MNVIVDNGPTNPSVIVLGQADKKIMVSVQNNIFQIASANQTLFTVSPLTQTGSAFTDQIMGTVQAQGRLTAVNLISDDYEIVSSDNQLQNWLVIDGGDDSFVNSTLGWGSASGRPLSVQQCAGVSVLGGPNTLNSDTISKTYNLPKHAQVRVTATFSFIDNWDDDTAFMKIDGQYMWTEEYNWCNQFFTMMCSKGYNACGKPQYPDKLSRVISVSTPHNSPTLTVEFGTTIPVEVSASEVSYGISTVFIEVR